jgi:hypothetical protein
MLFGRFAFSQQLLVQSLATQVLMVMLIAFWSFQVLQMAVFACGQ